MQALEAQAPQQDSPPSETPAQPDRNAAVADKVRSIQEAARAKLITMFRDTQGIAPAPVPRSVEQAPVAEQAPVPEQKPASAPAADPQAIAQAFTAQLNRQFQEAERTRQEANAKAEAALREAQEAKAKLAQFEANPAAYLQAHNLTIDEWNARLANGGEQTPEEKRLAATAAEWEAKFKSLESRVTQVTQVTEAQQQTQAVSAMAPVLASEFPLVNKLLGPDAVVQHLREQVAKTQRPFKSETEIKAAISALENGFVTQYQASLQDKAIATKLGVSVLQSPQAVVAEQSPQTLTNRVTSTVAPSLSRPKTEADRIARGKQLIEKLYAEGRL